MGPAQGAFGGEGQFGSCFEHPQILKGLVVKRRPLARHLDLKGHLALGFGLGVDEALFRPLGVAGLEHVEVFGPNEGQAVVEAALDQIHKGTRRQGGVVAIHHRGEITLGGGELHRGPAEQPG